MFELLITACMIGAPGDCREARLPGGDTIGECRVGGRIGALGFNPRLEVQSFPCVPKGTSPDFTVSEVAPGVFVHKGRHEIPSPGNGGDIANIGFVVGSEAVAVIDTGSTRAIGAALLRAVRAETDLPIRYIILTHMHPDHALGTAAFLQEPAEVVAHARMAPALEARAENYREALAREIGPAFDGTEIVSPTFPIVGTQFLDLGAGRMLRLTAHETAHTDNDLTVLDETTGTLFAGDLDFHGHLPALDGSLTGWQAVLSALAADPAVERVVPGHGPVVLSADRAFTPTQRYLDRLAADSRAAIREGVPMLEAIRSIAAPSAENWLLFEEFNPRNATAAFKELEWE